MNKKITRNKLVITAIAIICVGAGVFTMLNRSQQAEAGWWDDTWLYRKPIAITNSGTAQTDFQVQITLDTTGLVTAGKIQADCDDLRLADINSNIIPHWMEPGTCNTASTIIWAKIASVPTTGATAYLYYGNPSASSSSSIPDTFIREIAGVQGAWDMDGSGAIATDDTLADFSGNSNTGTASNVNTTGMAYASSQFAQGVDFDGTDDYVDAGAGATLDITDAITIEAWMKPAATQVEHATPISKGGVYKIRLNSNIVYCGSNTGICYGTTFTYTDDQWIHIAWTFSNVTGDVTTYKNGVQQTPVNCGGSIESTGSSLVIGADSATSRNFNGSIDQVRIYNRALSQTEITDLYGTGGDRQGYVTTHYPNKSLVRKYSASVSAGSPGTEEKGPGPVGYWSFDEGYGDTAYDSSDNANNGDLAGACPGGATCPTWQTEDMCVSGKCLKFDGTDDYVNCGNNSSLNLAGGDFTAEAWINLAVIGRSHVIMGKWLPWFLYVSGSSNKPTFYIRRASGGDTSVTADTALSAGKWYHVVAIHTHSDHKVQFYLNGKSDGHKTLSSAMSNDSASNFRVGYYGNSSNLMNGSIDEVRIYPYARTAAQIKKDYNAGLAGMGGGTEGLGAALGGGGSQKWMTDGLVGFWKMDEASWTGVADEVVDSSGAGNHGVSACTGGGCSKPTTGAGKFGKGGIFDGTDDYVDCGNDSSLDITDAITIEAWVKPENTAIGGTITTYGSYTVHTFISNGTFEWKGDATNVEVLVVGGGGSAGSQAATGTGTGSGGGGAGGLIYNNSYAVTNGQNITVTIGSGGTAPIEGQGNNGGNSVFGTITATGGGGGGWRSGAAANGGSGGGGGYASAGGTGIAGQGHDGGTGTNDYGGSGGGGANEVGVDGNGYNGQNGGSGTDYSSVFGTGLGDNGWFAGGGGGGARDGYTGGSGGNGGGGDGSSNSDGISATANTGGGGGGSGDSPWDGGNGGSGIVLVRYVTPTIIGKEQNAYKLGISNSTIIGAINNQTVSASATIGTYQHVVLSYNGSSQKLYVNGILQTEQALTGVINTNVSNLTIGDNFFNGSIDQVRIYNRALSTREVRDLYNFAPGPYVHLPLNEHTGTATVYDHSSYSNNGTIGDSITESDWVSGKYGTALKFEGNSNDKVTGSISPAIYAGGDYTQELWFYPTSASAGCLIDDWNNAEHYILMDSDRTVKVNYYDGSHVSAQTTYQVPLNQWTHVAGVIESGDSIKIYINGVLKATNDSLGGIETRILNDYVLGQWGGGSSRFYGYVDDVRIYNYARSAKQITQDLNAGHPAVGSPVGSAVAHWKFDEGYGDTAYDSSIHNNDGNLAGACPGAATCPSWTNAGKFGKALSFDGGDYVDCGNGSSLNITEAITISAWVKLNSDYTSIQAIVSNYIVGNTCNYALEFGRTDNEFTLLQNGATVDAVSSVSLSNNDWHHIVIVRSGSTGNWDISWYFDGIFDETDNTAVDPGVSPGNTAVGRQGDIDVSYFDGTIDEVKIYNYALTEDEVRVEYNQGKAMILGATGTETDGKTPSFSANREYCVPGDTTSCNPPVAEWKMDERTGSYAYDTSGNGNKGTLTNMESEDWKSAGQCHSGSCLDFDGSNDLIEATDIDLQHMTLSLWLNTTYNSTTQGILSKYDNHGEWNYQLYSDTNGKINYNIGSDNVWETTLTSNTSINDGNWHYVIATYDQNQMKIYIDGKLDNSVSENRSLGTSGDMLYIGTCTHDDGVVLYYDESNATFTGKIDHVKIYNYARTPAQVAWSYNRGKPVAHWRFDECQGTVAHDESGNGNTGTINIQGTGSQTSVGTCTDGLSTSAWYNGATGKINSAMSFDGTDDYVIVPYSSDFHTNNKSAGLWFKANSLPGGSHVLLGSWYHATLDRRGWAIYHTGSSIRISVGDENHTEKLISYGISTDRWYHVAFSHDYDNSKLYFYVNGINVGETNITGYYPESQDLGIGTYTGGAEPHWVFNGSIDDVKIYNYALTPEQVRMDYNAGAVNFK